MAKSKARSNVDIINDLRQNYKMSYEDFSSVWRRYDVKKDGTTERVESCVRDMISMVNVPTMSPYKEALCEVLSEKVCHVHKMAALLPVSGEMFVKYYNYAPEGETSSVAFMALWKKCDVDKNGFLDQAETLTLVQHLLKRNLHITEKGLGVVHRRFQIEKKVLEDFVKRLFLEGDDNQDGKLQLRELAALLNVEKNFLDICPKKLQQKELGDIFQHYDKDASGCVEGPEFLAFVRDVLNIDKSPLSRYTRKASDVDADELAMAGNMIMGLVDEDNDGRLNRSELGVVMEKPKTRLVCKSREFMEMQSSFDAG